MLLTYNFVNSSPASSVSGRGFPLVSGNSSVTMAPTKAAIPIIRDGNA